MNTILQSILSTINNFEHLGAEENNALLKLIKKLDSEIEILEFKLGRTEKIKRTTGILLEETIEELEQKRKGIEESNSALNKSLEELKSAQAQLIQSEKMSSLGELTAGIAHEIQNPLNFVNNFSEVNVELLEEMKEEMNDGNVREAESIANDVIENELKIIYHGKRADGIVKNMLQHSRSRSGEKIPTDINKLVDEYLRLAYHGLRAKDKSFNAIMETDFDESIGKINIIPPDIGRVILNLITNAFYAVQDRSTSSDNTYRPTVSVTTKLLLTPSKARQEEVSPSGGGAGGGLIQISVSDNGNGIPEEVKDKIFQPFFTTKPTGQGTGLGLSLSYDIVKAHGGEIKVESAVGKGSKFLIELPKV
ncbi:MAG: ATP-binding protein [Saprospiraceae bacterium]